MRNHLACSRACAQVAQQQPLVHVITNYLPPFDHSYRVGRSAVLCRFQPLMSRTVEDGTPFLAGLYFRMDIVVLAREPRDVSFPGYHQKDLSLRCIGKL